MSDGIHSLGGLGRAFQEASLKSGLKYCEEGDYESAVEAFDVVKDLSSLALSVKSKIKEAYYARGKHLQHLWRLQEARYCFERARQTDYNDIVLLHRKRLLESYRSYRTIDNIGKFRAALKEGFTAGEFAAHAYPFITIAEKNGLLQEPREPIEESEFISGFYTIGVYRPQYEGRHSLSGLIRQFKYGKNADLAAPFAWLMADYIRCRTELIKYVDLIVPSPSNPNKQHERGFTPCLLIARELSACLAIPCFELFLVRPMDCRFRQLPYSEGKELIRYKSGQCHDIASERTILLLDDVATTGRTLSLLADVLTEGGAKSVFAITVAKTSAPREQGN